MTPPVPARIELCLISHTNAGKTTLTRTLLGRDVGEVRDEAHVTRESEVHELIRTDEGDRLLLCDTPGLGDSVRLHRRLSAAGNPIGWFLTQVWDRWTDRTFYLSQQAMMAARDRADVVLYLLNSAESPRDAGYLPAELAVLAWLDKPVIVLLNQTGEARDGAREAAEVREWSDFLAPMPVVDRVMALDAFTRCWIHEAVFYRALGPLLAPALQPGHRRLLDQWEQREQQRFGQSMLAIGGHLCAAMRLETSAPVEPADGLAARLKGPGARSGPALSRAWDALAAEVSTQRRELTRKLLALHHLEGQAEHPLLRRFEHVGLDARIPTSRVRAGLLGAVVSGAAGGLGADALAGGLTLGAGAAMGAVAGALGFAAGAMGLNRVKGVRHASARLSVAALQDLVGEALLQYLAVAHFGRGRGGYREGATPDHWARAVVEVVSARAARWPPIVEAIRSDADGAAAQAELVDLVSGLALDLLATLYPQADIGFARRGLAAATKAGAGEGVGEGVGEGAAPDSGLADGIPLGGAAQSARPPASPAT
jgi:GTPase SAR1 family protein